jgi:hypothetical protein
MVKPLEKETYNNLKTPIDYYKKAAFQFLDIGLFESAEIKKPAFKKFFAQIDMNKKFARSVITLLENDPILMEMFTLWASKETAINLSFIEMQLLSNFHGGQPIIRYIRSLISQSLDQRRS